MSKQFKTHKRGKVDPKDLETVREFFDKELQKEELHKQFLEERRKNPSLIFSEWFKDKLSELKEKTPARTLAPDSESDLPQWAKDVMEGKEGAEDIDLVELDD